MYFLVVFFYFFIDDYIRSALQGKKQSKNTDNEISEQPNESEEPDVPEAEDSVQSKDDSSHGGNKIFIYLKLYIDIFKIMK